METAALAPFQGYTAVISVIKTKIKQNKIFYSSKVHAHELLINLTEESRKIISISK